MKQRQWDALQTAGLCRGFCVMLHGGIGLADSAFLLGQDQPDTMKPALEIMGKQLDQGSSLWEAMVQTGVLPTYASGLVRIGEETGHLEETLEALADYYEENHRTERLIKQAVAYPGVMLLLMLCVIGVLLMYVMPVFDRVYASFGTRLTGLSAALLALGQLLEKALPVLAVLLAAGVLSVLVLLRIPALREWVFRRIGACFGDRGTGRKFNNARFLQAVAMGMGSGLTPEQSLALARGLPANLSPAARRLEKCAELVEAGTFLPEAMEVCGLLSPSGARMLAVGLRSGTGDRVMEMLARQLMEEARQSVEDILARVEPAMVLLSSGLVGIILLSALVPLMNIMTAIG